jgi:hypothetical protein
MGRNASSGIFQPLPGGTICRVAMQDRPMRGFPRLDFSFVGLIVD